MRKQTEKQSWQKKVPWLICLGSVLLFTSWILQNYLQSSWAGEKEYLDKTQILVSSEEGQMNEWLTFLLQERGKQKFEHQYIEVVQREENSNRWFFWAYVIGSLLISIDFIKSKIQS